MTHKHLVFLFALFLTACGGGSAVSGRAVDLSGNWQAEKDYEAVNDAWTRTGTINTPLPGRSQVLEVKATLKSPAWRYAYTNFLARTELMSEPRKQALLDRMKKEESEFYEVVLLVAVDQRRTNDLNRKKTAWRVALVDDSGAEVEAQSIARDRRPRAVIAAEYPHLGHFHDVYVAKFPKSIALFRPDAQRVGLRIGSPRGAVELVWEAKKSM